MKNINILLGIILLMLISIRGEAQEKDQSNTYLPVLYHLVVSHVEPSAEYVSKNTIGNIGFRKGIQIGKTRMNDQWIVQYGSSYEDAEYQIDFMFSTKHEYDLFLLGKSIFIIRIKTKINNPIELLWEQISLIVNESQIPLLPASKAPSIIPPNTAITQSFSLGNTLMQMTGIFPPRDIMRSDIDNIEEIKRIESNIDKECLVFLPFRIGNETRYMTFTLRVASYELIKEFPNI